MTRVYALPKTVYASRGDTTRIDFVDWCDADRERYGRKAPFWQKDAFKDKGCEHVSPSCLECPLVICVEEAFSSYGSVTSGALIRAVRATEKAGMPIPPHLQKYLLTEGKQAGHYARVTNEERGQWRKLHQAGMSTSAIARSAGRPVETVRKALKRAGKSALDSAKGA